MSSAKTVGASIPPGHVQVDDQWQAFPLERGPLAHVNSWGSRQPSRAGLSSLPPGHLGRSRSQSGVWGISDPSPSLSLAYSPVLEAFTTPSAKIDLLEEENAHGRAPGRAWPHVRFLPGLLGDFPGSRLDLRYMVRHFLGTVGLPPRKTHVSNDWKRFKHRILTQVGDQIPQLLPTVSSHTTATEDPSTTGRLVLDTS